MARNKFCAIKTTVDGKRCMKCDCVLTPRRTEGRKQFADRLFCSVKCRAAHKPPILETLSKRSKINLATGCVEWVGSKNNRGYGQIRINYKCKLAHRVSLEATGQTLSQSDIVMHSCDNPCCINPFHLKVGSPSENVLDAVNKGRKIGAGRKLTSSDASEAKRLLREGMSQARVGEKLGVCRGTIQCIVDGRTWRGVQ